MDSARSSGATAVSKDFLSSIFRSRQILLFTAFCLSISFCSSAFAQDSANSRSFPVSVEEAKAAVKKIAATTQGRLPTLEGFVQQADFPMERYDKGFYEIKFLISPAGGSATSVLVTSKVTAWYSDPDSSKSGYCVLVSNGRLESDALDRIADILTPRVGSGRLTGNSASAPLRGKATVANLSSPNAALYPAQSFHPTTSTSPPPPHSSSFESTKTPPTPSEKRAQELSDYIKDLEEIQRNQAHPADLAAVKRAKTPVFAKPVDTATVLMEAEAQDEFQVLGLDGAWVHVQISGASRGWIRRAQLEMPLGFSQPLSVSAERAPATDATFTVAKVETTPFRGDWAPLKGKPVRIEWVEPSNPAVSTTRREKLAFAKSVFLRASKDAPSSSQPTEGIVVVFDSADGGQIAAPMSSVKALADRTLSDTAFWHQCSIDPPESFVDSAK
jgi:hypothetical protein